MTLHPLVLERLDIEFKGQHVRYKITEDVGGYTQYELRVNKYAGIKRIPRATQLRCPVSSTDVFMELIDQIKSTME